MANYCKIANQNGIEFLSELIENSLKILKNETQKKSQLLGYEQPHINKKIKIKHIEEAFHNMYPPRKLHLLDIWYDNPHLHNPEFTKNMKPGTKYILPPYKTIYDIEDFKQFVGVDCEIKAYVYLYTIIHQHFPPMLSF